MSLRLNLDLFNEWLLFLKIGIHEAVEQAGLWEIVKNILLKRAKLLTAAAKLYLSAFQIVDMVAHGSQALEYMRGDDDGFPLEL